MMKILLLVISFALTSDLRAQEWFPVGASWYYNQVEFGVGESYSYFEVTGEIVIQGGTCKVVSGSCLCGVTAGNLCQDGDQIYVFHSEADSFRLLYDFSLEAGDTFVFDADPSPGGDGDGYFFIDSITYLQVGSLNLRVQHITHLSYEIVLGNRIIERIGSTGCLFPQNGLCDPLTGGLRCYEDDIIGLINFQVPTRPCNYVSTAVDDPSIVPLVKLFPNPATNSVNIDSEIPIEKIILFNNLSIPVYQKSSIFNTQYELDVWSYPAGLYYIQVVLSDHQIVYHSIVIQK